MSDPQRIEALRERLLKDPDSIAFAQLAEEYRRAGQLEDAVGTCRTGLAVHPAYHSARVTLGRTLVSLGQLADAEREFETVLHAAPENLAAIRGLADIHLRRGDLDDALTRFKAALSLARNDPELELAVLELSSTAGGVDWPAPLPSPVVDAERMPVESPGEAERLRARRLIDALERFRSAIHVHRANGCA